MVFKYKDSVFPKRVAQVAKHLEDTHVADTTPENHEAIYHYTGDIAEPLNYRLRNNEPFGMWKHEHDAIINHIDAQKPLSAPLHTFSATGDFDPTGGTKGGTYHNKSFISSSINPVFAKTFHSSFDNKQPHIIHFKLPIGYNRGAYIDKHSKWQGEEHEFLLKPDQKWKHKGTISTVTGHVHTFEPVE